MSDLLHPSDLRNLLNAARGSERPMKNVHQSTRSTEHTSTPPMAIQACAVHAYITGRIVDINCFLERISGGTMSAIGSRVAGTK